MPTILGEQGYRFFFFSNEGEEPAHVHVESGDGYAKIWFDPVEVAHSIGYKRSELVFLRNLVIENVGPFKEKWDAYFGG
jgi:hypothetical protein